MEQQYLREIFDKHQTDKGSLMHCYDGMYAEVFMRVPVVNRLLEVGILKGQSLTSWQEVFPNAFVVGTDIKIREDIVPAAASIPKVIADSMSPSVAGLVGSGYNVIIDDGDHRPEAQWATFQNLAKCWTHAYVIEDIVGIGHTEALRDKIVAAGYQDVAIYKSAKSADIDLSGVKTNITFHAIVVYK
jgi:hypothetical protein